MAGLEWRQEHRAGRRGLVAERSLKCECFSCGGCALWLDMESIGAGPVLSMKTYHEASGLRLRSDMSACVKIDVSPWSRGEADRPSPRWFLTVWSGGVAKQGQLELLHLCPCFWL